MKKRTLIEAPLFLILLGVGVAIAMRLWTNSAVEAPEQAPTPTPRVANLLRSVPVTTPETPPEILSPTPNPLAENPTPETVESETGILVVQVREADGSLPLDPVWLRTSLYSEELPIERGRLVLEVVTGTLPFDVVARNGEEIRETEPFNATISPSSPTLLEFILPAPAPRFISSGLELQRQPDGYWTVSAITPGSAAAQAGLQPDDAVLSLHGQTPETYTDAQTAEALIGSPGDRIPLQVVIRNEQGELEEHQVELVIPQP